MGAGRLKFLTVLLVIAVMFTFSFGSAFAATVDKTPIATAQTNGYAAIDNAAKTLASKFVYDEDGYLASFEGIAATGEYAYLQKATIDAEIELLVAAAKKAVQDEATAKDLAATTDSDVQAGALAVTLKAQTEASDLASGTDMDLDVARGKQLVADKKAAKAELEAYTTTQYSDDTDDWSVTVSTGKYQGKYTLTELTGKTAGTVLSAKEFVEAVIATRLAIVEAASASDSTPLKNIARATAIASDVINGHKITATENFYMSPVPTKEELEADTSVDTAKKAGIEKVQAALKAQAVEIREKLQDVLDAEAKKAKPDADKVAAYTAAINALDKEIAAAEEVYTGMINAETTTDAVKTKVNAIKDDIAILGVDAGYPIVYNATKGTCTIVRLDNFVAITEDVDALEAYAKQVVSLIDRTAQPYFDEAAVNDALKAQISKLYTEDATLATAKAAIDAAASVKDALISLKARYCANVEAADGAAAITIGTKNYAVWADPYATYASAQRTAYLANIDKTLEAIEAATSYDEIKTAYLAGVKANEAFITKAQHATDWAAGGKLKKEFDKNYATELTQYTTYAVAKLNATAYSQVQAATSDINDEVDYIVKKAYTIDEIPTQVAAAKAYLDSLKSDAELKAEKAAVDAKIVALKSPVTIADKAQILEAKEAFEDYAAETGSGIAAYDLTLKNAVENLAKLEMKAIQAEITKYQDAGVTVADEAAIQAIEDALDEYEDNYAGQLDDTDSLCYNAAVPTTGA